MLNKKALDSAVALTDYLDEKGILVVAVKGSPLDVLTQHCLNRVSAADSTEIFDNDKLFDCATSICSVKGYDEHGVDLQELTKKVSESVRNHLAHARTIVVPEVTHFVDNITPVIDEISRSPLHEIEIVQNASYGFMLEPALLDALEKYKDVSVLDVTMNFCHGTRTDEQVLALMKTGSVTLDETVAIYCSKLSAGTLQHVWETMFTNIPQQDGDEFKTFQKLINEELYSVCRSLITFLVAKNLLANPQEDAGLPLATYNDLLQQYVEQSALGLLRAKYRLELADKIGYLVDKVVKKDGFVKIYVNPTLYKKWINEGGDNEVLFGLSLVPNASYKVSDINENSLNLKANWQRHVVMTESIVRLKKYNKVRDILSIEFQTYIQGLSSSELPFENREQVINRFNKSLECTKSDEVDNIYQLVLKLICHARYPQTSAYFILTTLDKIKKENPTMQIKEAAAIMTAQYIANWVGSMFRVSSI